jgi:hypothetical protein
VKFVIRSHVVAHTSLNWENEVESEVKPTGGGRGEPALRAARAAVGPASLTNPI